LTQKLSARNWDFARFFKPDLNLRNRNDLLFLVLFVVDIFLRMLWLDKPSGSLIFDEWYYVNVARVILGLPQSVGSTGQPPYPGAVPGLDPNHEHPPLAKLLIALSMYLLGDNAYGWRFPSVIFGSLSVLVFYLLMKKIAKHKVAPLMATFLFSFDMLLFVQSRIAILDIFMLAFMLLGFYSYFSNHHHLSAVAMALAVLAKFPGLAGLGIIVVVHVVKAISRREEKMWDHIVSWFLKYVIVFVGSFLIILLVLDHFWTSYRAPFGVIDHLKFILNYSGGLTSSCPNGIISCPWQWLINDVKIPYLIVNVQETTGAGCRKYDSAAFWGMVNPTILYLTIPAMIYAAYSYFERKDDLSLFMIVWFAASYVPFLAAATLANRVTYLFYFLPAVPAVAGAVSHMIADQYPPKVVVLFYLAVVVGWFLWMFPVALPFLVPFKTVPC